MWEPERVVRCIHKMVSSNTSEETFTQANKSCYVYHRLTIYVWLPSHALLREHHQPKVLGDGEERASQSLGACNRAERSYGLLINRGNSSLLDRWRVGVRGIHYCSPLS